jgi:hypothetical protein
LFLIVLLRFIANRTFYRGDFTHDELDLAAGFFDSRLRGFRSLGDLEIDFCFQFAITEQLYAVALARDDAAFNEGFFIDLLFRVDFFRVDCVLQLAEIDLDEVRAERFVAETEFRQAAVERRLAAFKAANAGDAGTGFLTLNAATCGFAFAGADTAADMEAFFSWSRVSARVD